MASCPVCSSDIPDDFGLIECPSCSAQLLVHMDGRVEYSGASDSASSPAHTVEETRVVDVAPAEESEENFVFGEPEVELPPDPPPMDSVDPAPLEDERTQITQPPSDESLDAFEIIPEEPPAELYQAPSAANASPDLSDVADFGNSDASGRDGSLRYDLIITGIDTADVREAFREAITDRKLVWDIDEILRSLKNGEVKIENVTPPKAYIVISRLRSLPVQVRWEQYAISQT